MDAGAIAENKVKPIVWAIDYDGFRVATTPSYDIVELLE